MKNSIKCSIMKERKFYLRQCQHATRVSETAKAAKTKS